MNLVLVLMSIIVAASAVVLLVVVAVVLVVFVIVSRHRATALISRNIKCKAAPEESLGITMGAKSIALGGTRDAQSIALERGGRRIPFFGGGLDQVLTAAGWEKDHLGQVPTLKGQHLPPSSSWSQKPWEIA